MFAFRQRRWTSGSLGTPASRWVSEQIGSGLNMQRLTTLPTHIYFPADVDDPEILQFVSTPMASLMELNSAAQSAEADFNKAAVEMEEAKVRWQVLQATLNMLTPIMAGKPEMSVAEAVLLVDGRVIPGDR